LIRARAGVIQIERQFASNAVIALRCPGYMQVIPSGWDVGARRQPVQPAQQPSLRLRILKYYIDARKEILSRSGSFITDPWATRISQHGIGRLGSVMALPGRACLRSASPGAPPRSLGPNWAETPSRSSPESLAPRRADSLLVIGLCPAILAQSHSREALDEDEASSARTANCSRSVRKTFALCARAHSPVQDELAVDLSHEEPSVSQTNP